MDAAPCAPSDGLASAGGDAQLFSCSLVVCLNHTAELDADGRDVLKACPIGCPDAEGMAINADVSQAVNAAGKFTKLRTCLLYTSDAADE